VDDEVAIVADVEIAAAPMGNVVDIARFLRGTCAHRAKLKEKVSAAPLGNLSAGLCESLRTLGIRVGSAGTIFLDPRQSARRLDASDPFPGLATRSRHAFAVLTLGGGICCIVRLILVACLQ